MFGNLIFYLSLLYIVRDVKFNIEIYFVFEFDLRYTVDF